MDPRWGEEADDPVDAAMERAVIDAIEIMREKLGEHITVDDMARAVMFSRFHFSRVFQRITGVSPGRFLAAVRLQEAKRLLLTTTRPVAEIAGLVGYPGADAFAARFREAVGLSPGEYRRLEGFADVVSRDCHRRMPSVPSARRMTTVTGQVSAPGSGAVGAVFIGLFPDSIPQGAPVSCTVLQSPGPYELDRVPPGTWHLLAHAMLPGYERAEDPVDAPLVVGSSGPITVRADTGTRRADLSLRPKRALDPPVLLALYEVRTEAMGG